ncbi:YqeG family HAD IIIA-type phosphatase [Bombilactobacillus thymidiniphilus]|uniref:YqeG family HAD IIIA-type phosphatase n=1 Tax=Bombilactobacillus thymidiniphilus TaxID=2923363 RepID=A0ABY4PCM1_9LACO|nr:YqeG family HAD IIIA-type phosphatase [Bombilactobacillus thymidiniphilus]UQS83365.1 YqeG family HAD IIIA-type phosphatase [Bombilactobacillus thymidiniphilus]
MDILGLFKPTMMVDQIMQIDAQEFVNQGIKVVLSDLDNTLVPWNKEDRQSDQLITWMQQLQDHGIELVIVSNNSAERVQRALTGIDIKIVARALKPLPFELRNYLKNQKIDPATAVMVGDQLMTDIMAGNLAGVKTILVHPLVPTDSKKTRVNRFFERPILKINSWLHPNLKWRQHLND